MSFVKTEDARRAKNDDPVLYYLRHSPLANLIDIPALEEKLQARVKSPYITAKFYSNALGTQRTHEEYHLDGLSDDEKVYFMLKEYLDYISTERGSVLLHKMETTGEISIEAGKPSITTLQEQFKGAVAVLSWNKMIRAMQESKGCDGKPPDSSSLQQMLGALNRNLSEFPEEGTWRVDFKHGVPHKVLSSQLELLMEATLLSAWEMAPNLIKVINLEAITGKGPFAPKSAGHCQ